MQDTVPETCSGSWWVCCLSTFHVADLPKSCWCWVHFLRGKVCVCEHRNYPTFHLLLALSDLPLLEMCLWSIIVWRLNLFRKGFTGEKDSFPQLGFAVDLGGKTNKQTNENTVVLLTSIYFVKPQDPSPWCTHFPKQKYTSIFSILLRYSFMTYLSALSACCKLSFLFAQTQDHQRHFNY